MTDEPIRRRDDVDIENKASSLPERNHLTQQAARLRHELGQELLPPE